MNIRNVLIIEPGFKSTRELVLKNMPQDSSIKLYAAWGLKSYNPDWITQYVNGTFDFSYTENNLLDKINEFEKKNGLKFHGICTWLDMSVHFVNEAAHELGLPVISSIREKGIKNKYLVRKTLKETGADTNFWFRLLRTNEDLENLLKNEKIHYPIIGKPPEMMASLAVIKIHSEDELREWFPRILNADFEGENLRDGFGDIEKSVLLEEFIEGDEYSVETLILNGIPKVLGVTKKYTSSGTYWDELGHTFPATDLSNSEYDRILSFVNEIHSSLQYKNSITHTEFRMQNCDLKGKVPRVMEINPRLCGDYIYRILELATNISTGKLMIHTALGEPLSVEEFKSSKKSYSVKFLTETKHCRISNFPKLSSENSGDMEYISFVDDDELIYKPKEAYGNRIGVVIAETSKLYPKVSLDIHYSIETPLLTQELENTTLATFLARPCDISKMVEVEISTWNVNQAASLETITKRVLANPEGAIVCFDLKSKKLLGFFTTILVTENELPKPLRWVDCSSKASFSFTERNQDTNQSRKLVGVSLTVDPLAPKGVGFLLMKSALEQAKNLNATALEYVVDQELNYHDIIRTPNFD